MKSWIYLFLSCGVLSVGCHKKPTKGSYSDNLHGSDVSAIKKKLIVEKKVNSWPRPGNKGIAIPLTTQECTWLGGKVVYGSNCEGTLQKCVAENGREMCISEVKER